MYFGQYVIVVWKESPSSKRRALHKCKLDFASWVLIHRLGIDLTFENQLYYKASDRAPASRNQAAPLRMYQSQLLAPAPGEYVFSRLFAAYSFFQRILCSECLLLKNIRVENLLNC